MIIRMPDGTPVDMGEYVPEEYTCANCATKFTKEHGNRFALQLTTTDDDEFWDFCGSYCLGEFVKAHF